MSTFTENDWNRLATLFDGVKIPIGNPSPEPYPGYKPETVEAPAGDTKLCPDCDGSGRFDPSTFDNHALSEDCRTCRGSGRVPNVDAAGACPFCDNAGNVWHDNGHHPCRVCNGTRKVGAKRYLHVSEKYLAQCPGLDWPREYLARAHWEACRVATALGVPAAYRPHESDGTLRVIDYPPGAGTVEHTDSNLFTIVLWRSHPADLEITHSTDSTPNTLRHAEAHRLSPGLHIGELGALVGLGPATPHRVPARPYRQRSIVYFAVPDHAARLVGEHKPWCEFDCECGAVERATTVGEYLADWKSRSRVAAAGEYR